VDDDGSWGRRALGGRLRKRDRDDRGTRAAVPSCKARHIGTEYNPRSTVGGPYQKKYAHNCPGCKGEITTLLTEGKWEHKCTLCKDAPCPK
jgi:hypothetical protein